MKQSELKEKILLTCLDEGMIQIQALYSIYDKQAHLKKFIYDMTKEGLLANRSRTIKIQNKQYDISYKTITNKGVQWLIDNCTNHYSWLKYMPNPMCDFAIKTATSNEGINRFLKTKSVSVLFSQIGIPTYKKENNVYKHTSNETITLHEIIEKARNDEAQDKKYNGKTNIQYFDEFDDNIIDYINTNTDKLEYPLSKEYPDIFYSSKDITQFFKITEKEINQYKFTNHI